jgi:hypothetical protein
MLYVCGYSIKFGIDVFFNISLVNNNVLVFKEIMSNELFDSDRGSHPEDGRKLFPILLKWERTNGPMC